MSLAFRLRLLQVLILILPCKSAVIEQAQPDLSIRACSGTGDQMREVYMTMGYYTDESCTSGINSIEYHSRWGTCPTYQPGDYYCFASGIRGGSDIYAKVLQSTIPSTQLDIVEDQQCLHDQQPAALVATFNANRDSCVRLFGLTGAEGVIIFPAGGSGVASQNGAERSAPTHTAQSSGLPYQQNPVHGQDQRCSGFDIASSEVITTRSQQISDIVNCRNSASPCQISHASQHETSIKSSFNLSSGISIGFFDVKAEFGFEYANTLTTSIQETVSVPVNQQGFLTTYTKATRFQGQFTGCDGVGDDTSGEVLALHDNSLTYQVVLTNG